MNETLSIIASALSIIAAVVSILAALKARSYRDEVKIDRPSGGVNFINTRSFGNGGDGIRITSQENKKP